MRVVIQKVTQASVEIDKEIVGKIGKGFTLLVGVGQEDTSEDVAYLVRKISLMRVFEDEEGKMNLSLSDVKGAILSISQFTLLANTKKGNRPSFIEAAEPKLGEKLYQELNDLLVQKGFQVETGVFGEDMQISLVNDGPVTIILDSKNK